ncbi:MAG: Smr/MutS family protein, partial [Candidatus Aphodosoma sp.]
SFAIEIARKIGLPDDVISAASAMVGTEQVDFDKHLQDVARDKRYWENKRQQVKEKEHRLQQLTERYEKLLDEMKAKQRDTLRQAKQQAADIIADANAQIERTVRTIRETEADRNTTKQLRAELKDKQQQLSAQAQKQQKQKVHQNQHPIAAGDHVRISGQDIVGQIIELQGQNATVAFGQLKTTVAVSKLEWVSVQQAKNITKQQNNTSSATSDIRQRQLNFRQEIDVRGMRVDEALQAVMYYIDDAHMVGASQVRILHGTGTGALRGAIRDYLHQSPAVQSYRDEHIQFGGAGITVVEMA